MLAHPAFFVPSNVYRIFVIEPVVESEFQGFRGLSSAWESVIFKRFSRVFLENPFMERIGARWMIDNAVKSEWKPDRSLIILLTMPPIRNETSTISKLIDLLPEKYFHLHFQNPQDLRTNCKKNSIFQAGNNAKQRADRRG